MSNKRHGTAQIKELSVSVRDWLFSEGYPLEFQAAAVLRRKGFHVLQGQYVLDHIKDISREIDVMACKDSESDTCLIRICQLVECKYSKDKPWVVFVSPYARMTESACAAQTIGSEYGTAIMWAIAGDEMIGNMELFRSPDKPGFGGREAFTKGNDRFYNTMKSITDIAFLLARQYDLAPRKKGEIPNSCVIAFPVN